ncbi:hypothetical protein HELRODRAFT_177722 [Helobdella robusta]|uniref:WSC domain-containing protein n=1 Tax=Helobdella robusta TaxID=6412 RepID=T1FC47_HELRO|nr:hypothetical protein HELRODRAFT_177722 [Helobdella robusta]ESN97667.1 hypothetical protein HELRODRAFT_177722 [Helobdella robusta]
MPKSNSMYAVGVEWCLLWCDKNKKYYAIKENMCFCSSELAAEDKLVQSNECFACLNGFLCGGVFTFAVYERNEYAVVGCFKIVNIKHGISVSSEIGCVNECYNLMFKYVIRKKSNEKSCQCGNKIEFDSQIAMDSCFNDMFLVFDVSIDTDMYNKSTIYQYCLNDEKESFPGTTPTTQTLAAFPGTTSTTQTLTQPTTKVYVNKCGENNGGCGDSVCIEVEPDNGAGVEANAGVKCYSPDEEFIEVPEIKVQYNYTYKGCFEIMHANDNLATASLESCFDFCSDSLFYGMKDRKYCACANNLENEVSANKCNKNCTEGLSCGGKATYSVYASKKSSESIDVGCYKYLELEHKHDQFLSKTLCLQKCKNFGFPYSGTTSDSCQCGRKIKFKDQVNIEKCRSSSSELVLLTDVSPDVNVYDKPTKYNYCINDKVESKKPYCRSGVCSLGWTGALCDNRDCSTNNGGCNETMMCVPEIVNNLMVVKCLCENGSTNVNGSFCQSEFI